jgi:signal transduction histidine kinase
MVSRIIALAVFSAVLVLAGGGFAWWEHTRSLQALIAARIATARTLYATGERRPVTIVRALEAPDIRVIVEDHRNLEVFQNDDGAVIHHPGGALPAGPLPIAGPPRVIGLPHGPRPPLPGARFPPKYGPLEIAAIQLSRLEPERAGSVSGPMQILVLAAPQALRSWLVADGAIVLLLLIAIGTITTITATSSLRADRRRLEAVATQRHALAAEYQRFLADAGHELRTPLTIATGYFDILNAQLGRQNPEVAHVIAGLKGEMTRMRALVEKMLLLARLETAPSTPSLVDAGSIAELSAEAMRTRFPGRDLILERDGPARVVIDQDDLYEALRNLIENALKYAPDSPVRVQARTEEGHALLSVTDHGPGIAAEEHGAVFERFYRGEGRGGVEGSGLGLAIVRRVATRWNGSVELDSEPRQTVFTLRFPLADEER